MKILGIETSCDETGAAIVEKKGQSVFLRSNILASSLSLHAKTGGIIPEIAAREQIHFILPVIKEAMEQAQCSEKTIDAIAITYGPGLIGSLLVGVETAKTLSYVWNKPIIPVNHLLGHTYANFISTINNEPITINFPAIALIVSGGHTDLLLIRDHNKYELLGGTRDDAAGEAFDKIGRLLGMPYPAGATIEQAAKNGNPKRFILPRPLIHSDDFNFSFSGLKTAALRTVEKSNSLDQQTIADISFAVQQAVVDVLVTKTIKAAKHCKVKSILLGGGVAANQKLRDELKLNATLRPRSGRGRYTLDAKIFVPSKSLCTDNAAMIATAAAYIATPLPWQAVTANPELYFS